MGSEATAAGGGVREPSEWPRSTGDAGVRAKDIRRAPQQEARLPVISNSISNLSGCSAVGSAPALGAGCREFESRHSDQKSTGFDLSIFYPLRKQWYIITRKRASHHRRCISSAAGCISFRNDDIQNFVLMICNSCGIDDIHGFRRDLCKSSNSYSIMPKISFS